MIKVTGKIKQLQSAAALVMMTSIILAFSQKAGAEESRSSAAAVAETVMTATPADNDAMSSVVITAEFVKADPDSVIIQRADGRYLENQQRFVLHFRWDTSQFDPEYLTNAEQLAKLDAFVKDLDVKELDRVEMFSYSSPEGVYNHNIELSHARSKTIKAFIEDRYPMLKDYITIDARGESWDELREYIVNDTNISEEARAVALKIIDAPDDINVKKERMKTLRIYKYLYETYYPLIRNSGVLTVTYHKLPEPVVAVAPIPVPEPEPEPVVVAPVPVVEPVVPAPDTVRKMIMAFRTNLLVPFLNVGVEVPFGSHWSAGLDYYYPWFVSKQNKWCGEMLGLFADVKYWFPGKKWQWDDEHRLQGHAIGLYGGVGYYDYQNIKQGYQGEYYDVGVDYTFALPLNKKKYSPRLEFNIGLGYIHTQARHYVPSKDYKDLIKDPGVKQYYYDYVGPSRIGVSLVLPIYAKRVIYHDNDR